MSAAAAAQKSKSFSDSEKAAMKNRAKELKAEARASKDREEGENAVVAAIAAMQDSDRVIAERLHALLKACAPTLTPKTWYGMPSYARDGKIVCFFQCAQKFNTRYATLGFNDAAALDEGSMWPVTYALMRRTSVEEARITELVRQALS